MAGGTGTRLFPLTKVINKHLLPIYDKPMIYFPINIMTDNKIERIIIVTDKRKAGDFLKLLGSGAEFNARFTYALQDNASGIADALYKARDFIGNNHMTVILGDNIIFGNTDFLRESLTKSCRIFLKIVNDPERFGIANIKNGTVINIVEKPTTINSNLAVIGLYQYKPIVFDVINQMKPSARNEMEITDINNYFIENNDIEYKIIKNEWIDAGTIESLFLAQQIEKKIVTEK